MRSTVTAQLVSACFFVIKIDQTHYFLNQKFESSYLTAWFVSDVVGNPEDSLSSNAAH